MPYLLLTVVSISAFLLFMYYSFPEKDISAAENYPAEYLIEKQNTIELQSGLECGAFSSAYLLRHFDMQSAGYEIYKNYPRKILNGVIAPKGILVFFRKRKFGAHFYSGNLSALKCRVSSGTPVILFLRVFSGRNYLHFVPVIGYDNDYLYIAESLPFLINCGNKKYNRKLPVGELSALWDTGLPFYKNTYIVVEKK